MDEMGYRNRTIPYAGATGSVGTVAAFMNGVYAWMCAGLCATGIVALVTANVMDRPNMMIWIACALGSLALAWVIPGMIHRMSVPTAIGLFMLYSVLNGVWLSVIFLVYSHSAIASAFLITAGMFGATSLYGFVTKRDLTSLGSLCFMGLIGIILASIINIFVASSALYWAVTYLGVAIFVGLTAYDTQKLKEISYQVQGDAQAAGRATVVGALSLYLDFINLLLLILRILGDKRN